MGPAMSAVQTIIAFILPSSVVFVATVMLCFYLHATKKRAAYNVTTTTRGEDASSSAIPTISVPEDQRHVDRVYDTLPPRYSTVDLPPPYSLFDPKLTNVWPGGPPPAYEMYPITLPLASHHWLTPTEPSPSPSSPRNPPRPQRTPRTSSS